MTALSPATARTTINDRTEDTDSAGLSFADTTDFDDADRGLVERSPGPRVLSEDGARAVWDFEAHSFLERECPPTVNPSLWRQSQLTAKQGLYEVTEGIYQIRGFDLSNMTLIEGERGVVVVDPLFTSEVAAAGLALYRAHRGDRPVTAVIYTHSHGDHFGGVLGVVDADTDVPIVAPEGFLEHAVAENVYAGTAMSRRGIYMYGMTLPRDPSGVVGTGLGPGGSTGTFGLVAPTVDITRTGQVETLDGVDIEFQLTPGTEAPSEMNFLIPSRRAQPQRQSDLPAIPGWFDGNPARLWPHPPEASALRYVEALGGQQATVAAARRFADAGDLRFAAQLLDHVVFADPADTDATTLLADVFSSDSGRTRRTPPGATSTSPAPRNYATASHRHR